MVVSILNSILFISFHEVKLYLDDNAMNIMTWPGYHSDAKYTVKLTRATLFWKHVDDIISREHYGALERAKWDRRSGEDFDIITLGTPLYDCTRQLYCKMFAKLAAKGMFDECDGQCLLHECVLLPEFIRCIAMM